MSFCQRADLLRPTSLQQLQCLDRVRVTVDNGKPFSALVEYVGRDRLLLVLAPQGSVVVCWRDDAYETEDGEPTSIELVGQAPVQR